MKVKYCSECRKETVHKLVKDKTLISGLYKHTSLYLYNISEYYQCTKCNKVTTDKKKY